MIDIIKTINKYKKETRLVLKIICFDVAQHTTQGRYYFVFLFIRITEVFMKQ